MTRRPSRLDERIGRDDQVKEHPLLLWFVRRKVAQDLEEQVARIALETDNDMPVNPSAPPGDEKRLRGIPVSGFGGAIAGTSPEKELLANERRRARRNGEA